MRAIPGVCALEPWQEAVAGLGEGACIVGVDEVGRGPLAGDVVAAAVVLDAAKPISGLMDSKKLSAQRDSKQLPN